MRRTRDSDDGGFESSRRRVLAGLAVAGVGLVGAGQVGAMDVASDSGGAAANGVGALPFAGFQHAALGEAGLHDADGSLLVDLGGEGGVTVDVGEAESFAVETGFNPGVEAGSYREFRGRGMVGGTPGQPVGTARITRLGGEHEFELAPTFGGAGDDSFDLAVFNRGDLVHEGGSFTTPVPMDPPDSEYVDYVFEWVWTDAGWKLVIRLGFEIPVFPPDEEEGVLGDELRVTPADPGVELGPVTDVDVVASGREAFAVDGETVGVLGHDHRQAGGARLHPTGDALWVDDVGLGGDGVTAEFEASAGFEVALEGADTSVPDSNLTVTARGRVDGETGRFGRATLFGTGEAVAIDADFTPLGAEGVHVVVLDGGDVVGEATVPAGRVAYLDGSPLVGWCGTPPTRPPCLRLRFDGEPIPHPMIPSLDRVYDGSPIPLPYVPTSPAFSGDPIPHPMIPDGPEFVGDELRLYPADPAVEAGPLTSLGVAAGGLEAFGVVDEQRL